MKKALLGIIAISIMAVSCNKQPAQQESQNTQPASPVVNTSTPTPQNAAGQPAPQPMQQQTNTVNTNQNQPAKSGK
jgi:PBP1b-binding outer membrane lipoprotein LpoB